MPKLQLRMERGHIGQRGKTLQQIRVAELQVVGKSLRGDDARVNQQLYALMVRKNEMVGRARRAVKLKARIDIWLYVHVPLSWALIALTAVHAVQSLRY